MRAHYQGAEGGRKFEEETMQAPEAIFEDHGRIAEFIRVLYEYLVMFFGDCGWRCGMVDLHLAPGLPPPLTFYRNILGGETKVQYYSREVQAHVLQSCHVDCS